MGEQVAAGIKKIELSWLVREKKSTAQAVMAKDMATNGGVAQLGEHLPCKQGVMSSNLTISTQALSHA